MVVGNEIKKIHRVGKIKEKQIKEVDIFKHVPGIVQSTENKRINDIVHSKIKLCIRDKVLVCVKISR